MRRISKKKKINSEIELLIVRQAGARFESNAAVPRRSVRSGGGSRREEGTDPAHGCHRDLLHSSRQTSRNQSSHFVLFIRLAAGRYAPNMGFVQALHSPNSHSLRPIYSHFQLIRPTMNGFFSSRFQCRIMTAFIWLD